APVMKLRTKTTTQSTRLIRRSTTAQALGLLAVWLLALGGCTKDPVEHVKPANQRPNDSTKPDKTTSDKPNQDSGVPTAPANDGQDANVSTPVVSDASGVEKDADNGGTLVDASADSGPTTQKNTVTERV